MAKCRALVNTLRENAKSLRRFKCPPQRRIKSLGVIAKDETFNQLYECHLNGIQAFCTEIYMCFPVRHGSDAEGRITNIGWKALQLLLPPPSACAKASEYGEIITPRPAYVCQNVGVDGPEGGRGPGRWGNRGGCHFRCMEENGDATTSRASTRRGKNGGLNPFVH